MAIENPPLALQVASALHPAELVRRALSSLLLGSSGGIVTAGDFAITEHVAANMSVNIAAGQAWVAGTSTTAQGQYYVRNNATVNPAISASDATNPRVEKIVVRVKDKAYAGAEDEALIEVIKGTAEAGATLPNKKGAAATPASSLVIGYVLVPAKATSIVAANIETTVAAVQLNVPVRQAATGATSPAITTWGQLNNNATNITIEASSGDFTTVGLSATETEIKFKTAKATNKYAVVATGATAGAVCSVSGKTTGKFVIKVSAGENFDFVVMAGS